MKAILYAMFLCSFNDRNPRVVALQILLNRFKPQGIVLETDGVCGRKTHGAVQAFHEEVLRTKRVRMRERAERGRG